MKTRRHFLTYIACAVFYFTLMPQSLWAFSDVIKQGLGATLVCPFNVINGPKLIGDVVVACFSDIGCNTLIGNYPWGGRGGTPSLTNGSHSLSNDAMANVDLTTNCANPTPSQSIQLQIHNPDNSALSLLCMNATVVSGVFTCTGGPYTLNINNL